MRAVQQQIIDCEHRIEEHMTEKDNLGAMCEDLQRKFKRLVQDNKFADFLRRIFKKKYRQPRIRDDDGKLGASFVLRLDSRLLRSLLVLLKSTDHFYITYFF